MSACFTNRRHREPALAYWRRPARRGIPVEQRVARSLPERWPAVLPGVGSFIRGSRPSTRGRGSLVAAPFQSGAGMDAKTRDLALLTALSLFCAGIAWIWITLFWVRSFLRSV